MSAVGLLQLEFRYRFLLAVGLFVGAIVGWATASVSSDAAAQKFSAEHVLVANPAYGTVNFGQASLFATGGEVPRLVAERLGSSAADLEIEISALPTDDGQGLAIVAAGGSADDVVRFADAYASELTNRLGSGAREDYRSALQSLEARGDGEPPAAMLTLQGAIANEASTSPSAIGSKPARTAIFALLGLALAGGLVLILDRTDTRLRTRSAAERGFGARVLAEVPRLPSGATRGELLAITQPTSPFMDAFRTIRNSLVDLPGHVAEAGPEGASPQRRSKVVAVVSCGPSEGKSTSCAHLGAALAELGQSVAVVAGDIRVPTIQQFFGVSCEPGLSSPHEGGESLWLLAQRTNVAGLELVASGPPTLNASPILHRITPKIRELASHYDVVLIDTAPLLVVNDASDLIQVADGAVMIARTGQTHLHEAEAGAELLRRLGVPLIGVALVTAPRSKPPKIPTRTPVAPPTKVESPTPVVHEPLVPVPVPVRAPAAPTKAPAKAPAKRRKPERELVQVGANRLISPLDPADLPSLAPVTSGILTRPTFPEGFWDDAPRALEPDLSEERPAVTTAIDAELSQVGLV